LKPAEEVIETLTAVATAADTAVASLFASRYCPAPRLTLPPINLPLLLILPRRSASSCRRPVAAPSA
jgi:hypothetical protein